MQSQCKCGGKMVRRGRGEKTVKGYLVTSYQECRSCGRVLQERAFVTKLRGVQHGADEDRSPSADDAGSGDVEGVRPARAEAAHRKG